jgi:myosin heavy subunit
MNIGSLAWVPASSTQARVVVPAELAVGNGKPAWLPVTLYSLESDGRSALFSLEWDTTVKIKCLIKDALPRVPDDVAADLSTLQVLNEGSLLNSVCQRFADYEFVSTIGRASCLFVNPIHRLVRKFEGHFNRTSAIYGYLDQQDSSPSLYQIADRAYRSVVEDAMDQSVIFRGAYGSGKTEALKHFIQYILVADTPFRFQKDHENSSYELIGSHANPFLLSNCPIDRGVAAWIAVLDLFGSVRTDRNESSSRHAKTIKFSFGLGKFIVNNRYSLCLIR